MLYCFKQYNDSNGSLIERKPINEVLTHSFSMHPFSIPWKHQKTFPFSDVFAG